MNSWFFISMKSYTFIWIRFHEFIVIHLIFLILPIFHILLAQAFLSVFGEYLVQKELDPALKKKWCLFVWDNLHVHFYFEGLFPRRWKWTWKSFHNNEFKFVTLWPILYILSGFFLRFVIAFFSVNIWSDLLKGFFCIVVSRKNFRYLFQKIRE